MRTYESIYREYCDWLVKNSGNTNYSYDNLIKTMGEQTTKALLFKKLLKQCYDPVDGLFYFCKFIVGDLIDIGYPKPFRYNNLLRKWDKLVKKHKKLAILAARGHGKSVWFSQIINLYDMFLYKFRRIIIVSASQQQANRLLDELKIVIENNEWLDSKRNKNRWATETIGYNGGYIIVVGIESEILGQHVDRIVMDDILRSDNKIKDVDIEDKIDMTYLPMLLNRDGQMVVVGTPKSSTEIFSVIEGRIKADVRCPWKMYRFPAIFDYEKQLLQCPDRFTWEDIMNKRLEMGPLKFSREYQLEFFSRDTSLFPPRLVDPAKFKGASFSLENKPTKKGPNWMYVMGVDVARSGSVSADFTVAITIAYNTINQEKHIVHMWREKGLKISEQARHISEIAKRFDNCMCLVETNNMGQDMIDSLVDDYNVFVEEYTVGSHRKKDDLVRFLISNFEHEQMVIPQGDEYSKEQMSILEDELHKFCVTVTAAGNERFEGVGSHDDAVDALALAVKATQIGGTPFAVFENKGKKMHSEYGAYTQSYNTKETDLVKLIRMGVIR